MTKITALLLAGSRPGSDPLAQAAGVAVKPLAPVRGEPMLNYPARALLAHPSVGQLVILTQTPELYRADPATAWLDEDPRVRFVAEAGGADIAVAMVERATLLARYPSSRRTWLKFRDGWWSGANLFWFGSAKARAIISLWQEVEQDRKKGWKILAAFGPIALLGAVLRVSTLRGGIARVGRRFDLLARLVPMRKAEACIDADKVEDVALIEQILDRRG